MMRLAGRRWDSRSFLSAVAFVLCFCVGLYKWQLPAHLSLYTGQVGFRLSSGYSQEPLLAQPSSDFIDLHQHPELPFAPYNPYPAYNSLLWRSQWYGKFHACEGPQGPTGSALKLLLARSVSVSAPNPNPLVGSYQELGLDDSHCFDRDGRFDAYGFGKEEKDETGAVDWQNVDWGTLQDRCIDQNIERYEHDPDETVVSSLKLPEATLPQRKGDASHEDGLRSRSFLSRKYTSRKAVLIRSWDSAQYHPEVTRHIRSLITDLSLHTGGEYAVYLVVEVKNPSRPIHNSSSAYQTALHDLVPREFQNITLLFNQDILDAWYPDIPAGGQVFHMNQPTQLFSLFNPQFTHVWDIELDVRYTSNWYALLSRGTTWARSQPRKYQWERASRYYLQSYYNTYANFTTSIAAANPSGGIWGPVSISTIPHPLGPTPPKDSDDWHWGVGEEADVISPAPIIDITNSEIFVNNTITGFPPNPPRRALMNTPVKGLSRRLLLAMHDAQVAGMDMRSELFAHTIALLHGFKVAVMPTPMFSGNDTIDAGQGDLAGMMNGTVAEEMPDKMMWLQGFGGYATFWWKNLFAEQFPRQLFRRWVGVQGENGGEEERLCLPAILLHPVKDV